MANWPLSAFDRVAQSQGTDVGAGPDEGFGRLGDDRYARRRPDARRAGAGEVARQDVEHGLLRRRDQDAPARLDGRGA